MAFCSKCGAKLEDGVKFCANCGAPVQDLAAAAAASAVTGPAETVVAGVGVAAGAAVAAAGEAVNAAQTAAAEVQQTAADLGAAAQTAADTAAQAVQPPVYQQTPPQQQAQNQWQQPQGAPQGAPQYQQRPTQQGASVQEKLEGVMNTADTTAQYNPKDIADNKVFAVLAYFGILVLIPLFAAKESPFARFHTNQGLILFIAEIALAIIGYIPILGTIISVVGSICCFILFIIGLVNAAKGVAKELPLVGSIKILK